MKQLTFQFHEPDAIKLSDVHVGSTMGPLSLSDTRFWYAYLRFHKKDFYLWENGIWVDGACNGRTILTRPNGYFSDNRNLHRTLATALKEPMFFTQNPHLKQIIFGRDGWIDFLRHAKG